MSSDRTRSSSAPAWWRHLGEERGLEQLLEQLGHGSIPAAAHATARLHPSREAIRIGDSVITHRDLDDGARRVASWLAARGARPGSRVVLAAANSVEYVVGYLGILHCGAAVGLVNPMLTPRELAVLVEDSDPVAALCDVGRVEQLKDAGVSNLISLQGAGDRTLAGVLSQSRPMALLEPDPDAVAHLAFTSGTTGRAKATPLSQRNVLSSVRSILWSWRIDSDDVIAHALPLQHAHGLSGLHAVLLSGCRGVFLRQFEPELLRREIQASSATVLFAVPAIWERLMASGELNKAELATLRLATSGSAPLSPSTSDAVLELTGIRLLERYGCTETGFVLSNPYEGARRPGSVGFALPGADVADADGRQVEDGRVGEIAAHGPSVFAGYRGREKDQDSFFDDGWFRTGDLAQVDPADGYVYIVGRSKDVIITGGLNVYPREVEVVLEALPGVAAAAVVGEPSKRWGEQVTAFLVPARGAQLDLGEVAAAVEEVLAAYKRPKSYRIVDDLPRNEMGKVQRSALFSVAPRPS